MPRLRRGNPTQHLAASRWTKPAKIAKSFNGRAQKSFSIKESIFAGFASLLSQGRAAFHPTAALRAAEQTDKNSFSPHLFFFFARLLEFCNEIFWRGYQSFSYFSTSSSSNWINSKKYFLYNSFRSSPLQISLISLLSISALIFSNFCFLTLLTIVRLCSSV